MNDTKSIDIDVLAGFERRALVASRSVLGCVVRDYADVLALVDMARRKEQAEARWNEFAAESDANQGSAIEAIARADRAEAALARVKSDDTAERIAAAITGRHGLANDQAISVAYKALWEIRDIASDGTP